MYTPLYYALNLFFINQFMRKSILSGIAVAATVLATFSFSPAPVSADGGPACPGQYMAAYSRVGAPTRDIYPTTKYQSVLNLCLESPEHANLESIALFEGSTKIGTIFRHDMPQSNFVWLTGKNVHTDAVTSVTFVKTYNNNGVRTQTSQVSPVYSLTLNNSFVEENFSDRLGYVTPSGDKFRLDFYAPTQYNANYFLMNVKFNPLTWVKNNGDIAVLNSTERATQLRNVDISYTHLLTNPILQASGFNGNFRIKMYPSARTHNIAATREAKGVHPLFGYNPDQHYDVVQTMDLVIPAL